MILNIIVNADPQGPEKNIPGRPEPPARQASVAFSKFACEFREYQTE